MHKCPQCQQVFEDTLFKQSNTRPSGYCLHCRNSNETHRRRRLGVKERPKRLTTSTERECCNCGQLRPFSEYLLNKCGNRSGRCYACRLEYQRLAARTSGVPKKRSSQLQGGLKLCVQCNCWFSLDMFNKNPRGLGGVSSYYKPCQNAYYLSRYDKEVSKKQTRLWRAANPERWRVKHRLVQFNRRAKIKATEDGSVTIEFVKSLYAIEYCHYCGAYTPSMYRTADHVIALAMGGPHTAANLVMACLSCNSAKGDTPEQLFREKLLDK